ncbi:hypothetical protein BHM03_00006552 [Ensete ventricosum]|nr:hypothetical protein BHM03_00006552 [Ensete ventricosum]
MLFGPSPKCPRFPGRGIRDSFLYLPRKFRLPLHTRPAPQHRPLSYRGFSAATPTIDLAPEPIACVWSISASISRRPIF